MKVQERKMMLVSKYCPACFSVTIHLRNRDYEMCGKCHLQKPLLKM